MNNILQKLTEPRRAMMIVGGGSFLLLAGAHAFERIGGLNPCPLCLDQREVHWAALAVCLIGWLVWQVYRQPRLLTGTLGFAGLVYAYSAWLGAYHAGVEWKWWEGPATCAQAGGPAETPVDILAEMNSAAIIPCTEAAWRLFGISMAGYNALASLALMAIAGYAAWRGWKGV